MVRKQNFSEYGSCFPFLRFTLRLASLVTLSFVPEVKEGKSPFIFAMATSGGKIEAVEMKGTVEGPSDTNTYDKYMYVWKTKEGRSVLLDIG